MRGPIVITAPMLAMLGACAPETETVDRSEVIGAIQAAEQAQAAALGRNDINGAYAVFTDDSLLYAQGFPPAKGREAIRSTNERVLKDPAFNAVIDEASRKWWVAASADLATTTYTTVWTHTDAKSGKPVTEPLTSQTTWLKQADGSWKNVMDINAVFPADPEQ